MYPSPNVEPRHNGLRPRILLLHYTGLPTLERSLDVLASVACKVSCHYVVSEAGEIIQMVSEDMRAWHAGVAYWAGETDINSLSIGIEIQNGGHAAGCPEFPEAQMQAVVRLGQDIVARHGISPAMVLGHSDVAPARKCDPGEKFDWARLAREGVGLWLEPPLGIEGQVLCLGDRGEEVAALNGELGLFGYVAPTTDVFDEVTEASVRAFQRHFRPMLCDGVCDASTRVGLVRLLRHRNLI